MNTMTNIAETIETLAGVGMDARQRQRVIQQMDRYDSLGEAAFWLDIDRDDEKLHALPGWPVCACVACGCSDPATCTDDGGVAVCGACSDYTVDDDGDVHCSNCEDIKPPEEPEEDSDGEWACYWDTVGDDSHVVGRYATRESAAEAVAAKDWPKPGDNTNYLCGYCVRQLVDGEWVRPEAA